MGQKVIFERERDEDSVWGMMKWVEEESLKSKANEIRKK